jgi:hypothetical protein
MRAVLRTAEPSPTPCSFKEIYLSSSERLHSHTNCGSTRETLTGLRKIKYSILAS